MTGDRLIHWLDGHEHAARDELGGKAMNLHRLSAFGLPTPAGFCVTTALFDRYLELTAPGAECLATAVRERRIPSALWASAQTAVDELVAQGNAGAGLAVRSSACDEDGGSRSFAGQFVSVLGVAPGDVEEAVRTCWSSLWSERASSYRAHGDDGAAVPGRMAVVVQPLLAADASAVAFTVDPVTGDRDRIIVNAVRGLGESLVSGGASGDTYVLDKRDLRLLEVELADAHASSMLSEEDVVDLAALALLVEGGFGEPVDVEAARADGAWELLQARPVTTV